MSFLGNITSKLAVTAHGLSPVKRWLALAFLVFVMCSVFVLCRPATTQYTDLLSGRDFTFTELTQIEQAFANAGLTKWQVDNSRVRVPQDQKSTYLAALQDVIEADTLNADMDLALKNSSLWEPRHVKDLKIKHAEEKQLSRMLATMKFIEDVTVRKDQIDIRGLRGSRETTALAAVKPTGDLQLNGNNAYAIRNAVAACYADLSVEHVTVLDLNSGRVFGGHAEAGATTEDPYAIRKRHYEQLYQDRVHAELSPEIPGIVIETYVTLKYAEKSTVASTPSPAADRPETTPSATRQAAQPLLVPRHVVASITLPTDYYQQVVNRQDTEMEAGGKPSGDATDLTMTGRGTTQSLQQRVTQLLQIPTSPNLNPPTAIVHINSSSSPSAVVADARQPTRSLAFTNKPWMWLGWIMFAVIGTGLLMQWMHRTTQTATQPLPDSSLKHPTDTVNEQEPPGLSQPSPLAESSEEAGDQLRLKLTDRIRQNPNVALHVLQEWLDEAA